MLKIGIKGHQEMVVGPEHTARNLKSGTMEVLGTPALAALMEETAWRSVAAYLEPGRATVGTKLELCHLAPSPVGMKVWCDSNLTEIDGRRLVFTVTAFDEEGKIGEGTQERVIIEEKRFQEKADAKHQG